MHKFLGFHPLRYGDIIMGQVAASILKSKLPNSYFTLCINNNYQDIAPLFIDNSAVDRIHILNKDKDGFNEVDQNWINEQKFDHVFNPMADHNHRDPWFLHRHQTFETAFIHGLISQDEINENKYSNQIVLNKWFTPNSNFAGFIALQAFAGSYDPNNRKALSIQKAQEIVDAVNKLGYGVLQLGIESEPKLKNTIRIESNYFESVKNMLGCKLLITTDSGFSWVSSGYQFPTIGLYSYDYYGQNFVRNIQPQNPNAIYFAESNVNAINIDSIIETIRAF